VHCWPSQLFCRNSNTELVKKQGTKLFSISLSNIDESVKYWLIFKILSLVHSAGMALEIPPHLDCVATILVKILMSESQRDLYPGALSCWNMNSPVMASADVTEASHSYRFHQAWLTDQRISNRCKPISTRRMSSSATDWNSCAKNTTFSSDVCMPCCSRCIESVIQWMFRCS